MTHFCNAPHHKNIDDCSIRVYCVCCVLLYTCTSVTTNHKYLDVCIIFYPFEGDIFIILVVRTFSLHLGGVFGCDLTKLFKAEGGNVPSFLVKCTDEIERRGRINSNTTIV